ncbi:MAG: hypothetical protein KQI35_14065 [Bacteroidetes bacterium]|nr:hypothetical protein [Bacteroidota bacterium]
MNTQNTENNLKKIFKAHGTVEPKTDITEQIMRSIQGIPIETAAERKEMGWYRWALVITGVISIAGLIYYFIFGNGHSVMGEFNPILIPVFKNIWINLKEVFDSFKVSSITIVILAGMVSLFMIERLLKKIQSGRGALHII